MCNFLRAGSPTTPTRSCSAKPQYPTQFPMGASQPHEQSRCHAGLERSPPDSSLSLHDPHDPTVIIWDNLSRMISRIQTMWYGDRVTLLPTWTYRIPRGTHDRFRPRPRPRPRGRAQRANAFYHIMLSWHGNIKNQRFFHGTILVLSAKTT